jgi:hypothetical protein
MPQRVGDFNPLLIFMWAIRVKSGTETCAMRGAWSKRLQFGRAPRQRIEVIIHAEREEIQILADRVRDNEVLWEECAVEKEASGQYRPLLEHFDEVVFQLHRPPGARTYSPPKPATIHWRG